LEVLRRRTMERARRVRRMKRYTAAAKANRQLWQ
jgi:hypothetical protein